MKAATAILLACVALVAAKADDLTAYELESEARRNPVGMDEARPRLSWKPRSMEQGQRQTAYQVFVASSATKLAAGQGDLWDSGRLASEESSWIPYSGAALRYFERCWWTLRVWDAAGALLPGASPRSGPWGSSNAATGRPGGSPLPIPCRLPVHCPVFARVHFAAWCFACIDLPLARVAVF